MITGFHFGRAKGVSGIIDFGMGIKYRPSSKTQISGTGKSFNLKKGKNTISTIPQALLSTI